MKKILVVDDNRDNQEILVHRLQSLGSFEIFVASDGKEALEVAARTKPDMIFMDIRMPVMDGYEATRELRKMEWCKDLPVIAVTAHIEPGDKDKALKAGCSDFISKPIDFSLIQRKFGHILRDQDTKK